MRCSGVYIPRTPFASREDADHAFIRGRPSRPDVTDMKEIVMRERRRGASSTSRLVTALHELVNALDRRVPQVQRPAEARIARDARALRREALAQLDALGRPGPESGPYDQGLADAIMTDDGCPRRVVRRTAHRHAPSRGGPGPAASDALALR